MHLLGDYPGYLDAALDRLSVLGGRLAKAIPLIPQTLQWLPGTNNAPLFQNYWCQVRRGLVHCQLGGRTVLVLQPGEWIGPFDEGGEQGLHFLCEDPASLACFPRQEFLQQVCAEPTSAELWSAYLLAFTGILSHAYGHLIKDQIRPTAGFSRYEVGEVILREGDPAEHVYTLLRGHARVFVSGQWVGDVYEGEIFGAISALIGATRSASVLASTPCTTMAVPTDQFRQLMQTHPQTCLMLMESMARKINTLNQRIANPASEGL